MSKGEITTNEIMELLREQMEFLQENVATKEDLYAEIGEARKDIRVTEHRIMDAMDNKLADLKGDLVVLMRKENLKLSELVSILRQRKSITGNDAAKILKMEPFPQIG